MSVKVVESYPGSGEDIGEQYVCDYCGYCDDNISDSLPLDMNNWEEPEDDEEEIK